MSTIATLTELLEANRKVAGSITYLEGEQNERNVTFAELYTRARGSCSTCRNSAPVARIM